jgi:lipoprotein-anchoring transpeptidase ErfK/SrfK
MDPRTTRNGTPERRDHSPPGRLRRIFFDHRGTTSVLLGAVLALAGLLLATSAWAVNERFKRDVTRVAHTRDVQTLSFLEEQERRIVARMQDTVATLEEEVSRAGTTNQAYLTVSLAERRVWYVRGTDTLYAAPVAVGSGQTLVMGGRTQRFQTPRGRMTITHKERDPIWVPPDWHYHRIAQQRGLRIVNMSNAAPDALTRRGFPAGREPIANGVIYIPPWGSPQRRHTGVLGAAKLEMRDGYYFHGTNDESSIGSAASAGCIRMRKSDILWMYENVPVGTPVYIY